MTTNANDESRDFARVVWHVEDVLDKANDLDVKLTQEEAEAFLFRNQSQIQSDMVQRGWDSVEALLLFEQRE